MKGRVVCGEKLHTNFARQNYIAYSNLGGGAGVSAIWGWWKEGLLRRFTIGVRRRCRNGITIYDWYVALYTCS